jgi:hypothetical protein
MPPDETDIDVPSDNEESGADDENEIAVEAPEWPLRTTATTLLVARLLSDLGALLADLGELVGDTVADPPKPPDPPKDTDFKYKGGKHKGETWRICEQSSCKVSRPEGNPPEIWCMGGCKDSEVCKCIMFRAKKGDKEWELDPREPQGDPHKRYPYDDDYYYACFCARRILNPK